MAIRDTTPINIILLRGVAGALDRSTFNIAGLPMDVDECEGEDKLLELFRRSKDSELTDRDREEMSDNYINYYLDS